MGKITDWGTGVIDWIKHRDELRRESLQKVIDDSRKRREEKAVENDTQVEQNDEQISHDTQTASQLFIVRDTHTKVTQGVQQAPSELQNQPSSEELQQTDNEMTKSEEQLKQESLDRKFEKYIDCQGCKIIGTVTPLVMAGMLLASYNKNHKKYVGWVRYPYIVSNVCMVSLLIGISISRVFDYGFFDKKYVELSYRDKMNKDIDDVKKLFGMNKNKEELSVTDATSSQN